MPESVELVKRYRQGDEFPPTSKLILLTLFAKAYEKHGDGHSINAFIKVLQDPEYFPECTDETAIGIEYSTFKANLVAGLENALRQRFPTTATPQQT